MKRLFIILTLLALVVAACGSYATPVPNEATQSAEETITAAEEGETEAEDGEEVVAIAPTETPLPPTETPLPPTATPTEAPTEVPPTETPAPAADPVVQLVQISDPANGETLFNETYETNLGPWACSTCHNANSEEAMTGPGMLNLNERAGERVEGQAAEVYVVNSIVNTNDYIVDGYNENVMPGNYEEIFSQQELYDLAAYLLSLEG